MWLPLMWPPLGTWPATQACALSGSPTGDPLVYRWALNPLSHTSQGNTWVFNPQCGQQPYCLSHSNAEMVIISTLSGMWPCTPKEWWDTCKNNEVNQNNEFYTLLGLRMFCMIFRVFETFKRIWHIRQSDILGLWFLLKYFSD